MSEELVSQTIELPRGELRLLQPEESAGRPDDGEWAPVAPYWSARTGRARPRSRRGSVFVRDGKAAGGARSGVLVGGRSPTPTTRWPSVRRLGREVDVRQEVLGHQRATFIINGRGRIAEVFPKVSPKAHDGVVLNALDSPAAAR